MRKPRKFDVSIDSDIDLESLAVTVAETTVAAYFCIKGFKTICSIVEHVVVTKVS